MIEFLYILGCGVCKIVIEIRERGYFIGFFKYFNLIYINLLCRQP